MSDHRQSWPGSRGGESPLGEELLDEGLSESSSPFRRLVAAPMVRRLSIRKLLVGLGMGAVLVTAVGVVGARLTRVAMSWLSRQPLYLLPFEKIELDPPPPPWIASGAAGLLATVRDRSEWRANGSIRILDFDPRALADAFRRGSPWVRDVLAIGPARYPNHLPVHLEYREPVLEYFLGTSLTDRSIVLDADGVVLDSADLLRDRAEPLARFRDLRPLTGPLIERPGRVLAIEGSQRNADQVPIAASACRLAGFLKARRALAGSGTIASRLLVTFLHEDDNGLWVQTIEKAMILWEPAREFDTPGRPMTLEDKWAALDAWLDGHRLAAIQTPNFLHFERGQVVIRQGIPNR